MTASVPEIVSVILPAYNAARFIGTAITSVATQSHEAWELLIVDDGSTDDTASVAAAHTADARVRVLRRPHAGVAAARNAALAEMKGDAFVFLDADDALTPNSLATRLAILRSQPEVEFVDGVVEFTDARLERTSRTHRPALRGRPFEALVALSSSCYAGATWMVRRRPGRIYRMTEGLSHCEDLLFYTLLSSGSSGLYDFTEDVTVRVRRGHASAMSDLDGLDRGYRSFLAEVARRGIATPGQLESLRRRIRRILWRSHARRGRFLAALRALTRPLQG